MNEPPDAPFVSIPSTQQVANSNPTAASMSTDLYGMATLDACQTINVSGALLLWGCCLLSSLRLNGRINACACMHASWDFIWHSCFALNWIGGGVADDLIL